MGNQYPKSIKEAVEFLCSKLSEQDRQAIRRTPEEQLEVLHFGLGTYIRNECGLWGRMRNFFLGKQRSEMQYCFLKSRIE